MPGASSVRNRQTMRMSEMLKT